MGLRGTQWTVITVWIIAATYSGRRSHVQALQSPADSDGGGDSGGLPVKPERCYGTDDILERHCCVFPPFYSRAVSRACGAATELLQQRAAPAQGRRTAGTGPAGSIAALRRRTPHGDEYWPCVLRRYGLTAGGAGEGGAGGEEETVSLESLGSHLSRWAARHPAFRQAVQSAARRCRRMYRPLLPLHAGHYGLLHTCLRTHINMDCPSSVDDPGCRLQKAFYDECRQYFI